MKKILAIVQARLGSSRLPLKSLLNLRGLPVINWVYSRLAKSSRISEIVVAIPDTPLDNILGDHLSATGIPCIKGPENDVLKRFCLAASQKGADLVIRVCADNPFIWWEAVDRLVDFYETASVDYAYNHIPKSSLWPDGLGAEIISAPLLDQLDSLARTPAEREHCLNYINNNPDRFKSATFNPEEEWLCRPDLKLDLDTIEDYQKLATLAVSPDDGASEIIQAIQNAQWNTTPTIA